MTNRAGLHHAIVDTLDAGRIVPCVGDNRWLSSNADDAAYAIKKCGDCPVLVECRTYAEDAKESAGVWAGKRRGHTLVGTYATRGLTATQKEEIDDLLADGATAQTVADTLDVTLGQVNHHRYHGQRSTP